MGGTEIAELLLAHGIESNTANPWDKRLYSTPSSKGTFRPLEVASPNPSLLSKHAACESCK